MMVLVFLYGEYFYKQLKLKYHGNKSIDTVNRYDADCI